MPEKAKKAESKRTDQIQREYLRPSEAARYLSVTPPYLRVLTERGIISAYRLGKKCTLYSRAELLEGVAQFKTGKGKVKQ